MLFSYLCCLCECVRALVIHLWQVEVGSKFTDIVLRSVTVHGAKQNDAIVKKSIINSKQNNALVPSPQCLTKNNFIVNSIVHSVKHKLIL